MPKTQGVSGFAVAVVAAGGLLAWSGIKGWHVSQVTRDLLSGKDPRVDSSLNSNALSVSAGGLVSDLFSSFNPFGILGGAATSAAVSASGGGGNVGKFSANQGFTKAFLEAIGAPLTPANIQSVNAWQAREGGGGANNPLNTTQKEPGSTSFNSVGVQNFISIAQGITANASVLLDGTYNDVLLALRSGNGLCGRSFAGLSRWSGNGYSSVC